MNSDKKIVAYKVELVVECNNPNRAPVKPEIHGLQGWVPWGNPIAVSTPGNSETGIGFSQVFQAFVKYKD